MRAAGFTGKLTASEWALLTKCLQDTAHRDLQQLGGWGVTWGAEDGLQTMYWWMRGL